ncbi:hypothetical protein F4780DRAFT_479953 [Xylariomycetidae sp. FL0641]|nr:hypothetical protein F4780DRAFT_479953 [Xylariomycetidae sp. FL0641]
MTRPTGSPQTGGPASRRSHPKSRTGCKTCKARKIKCDEQKPACGNCIKHNVDCDFRAVAERQGSGTPTPGSSSDLNMQDLELIHNFTTSTFSTMSESLVIRDFYRISLVQIGFACDYIMRALLAVSALQLAHYRPHMRDYYQSLAMTHHQKASRTVMALMTNVDASTAQNLFLFSVLTVFVALASPRKETGFLLVGESGFPDWMFLLQGTRGFVQVMGEAAMGGVLAPIMNHGKARYIYRADTRERSSPAHLHLDYMRTMIARQQSDPNLVRVYDRSIEELQLSYAAFDNHNNKARDVTDAFVWIFEVAEDLLPLLRVPTQEAVAIFAFFCVLFKRLENQWWLHGWADHLIEKSYYLLDEEHRLWIRWPIEEIGWVPAH